MSEKQVPTRNLAMELVRVTEAAALAAARWVGRGDKEGADGAAVDAMRLVLDTDRLVAGDNCFFAATGITDGELLRGVRYRKDGASTQSLVMRSRSGTVRLIEAQHRIEKIQEYSSIELT